MYSDPKEFNIDTTVGDNLPLPEHYEKEEEPSNSIKNTQPLPPQQNPSALSSAPLDKGLPNMTDFEKNAVINEYKKTKYLSAIGNTEQIVMEEHKMFYNQSIVEIMKKLSDAIIGILTELTDKSLEKTRINVIKIFTKEDRLIYIGIFLLIIAICIFLMFVAS